MRHLLVAGLLASAPLFDPLAQAALAQAAAPGPDAQSGPEAAAETEAPLVPVLRLERIRDALVVDTVTLFSAQIDPNAPSGADRWELRINDRPTELPPALLNDLLRLRREFADDTMTGGISDTDIAQACRAAGPAAGDVLSVLYLTYQDERIVKDELRAVFSDPANCLFTRSVHPALRKADIAAAGVSARLQTLLALLN